MDVVAPSSSFEHCEHALLPRRRASLKPRELRADLNHGVATEIERSCNARDPKARFACKHIKRKWCLAEAEVALQSLAENAEFSALAALGYGCQLTLYERSKREPFVLSSLENSHSRELARDL